MRAVSFVDILASFEYADRVSRYEISFVSYLGCVVCQVELMEDALKEAQDNQLIREYSQQSS